MRSNKFNKFDRRSSLHTRINGNACSQANLVLPIFPLAPPSKGVGLCNNTGVDCFINSTLQCLMHIQPFANFLERNLRCSCSGFCGLRELSILRMCALRARYTIRNRDLHRNIKVIDPFADAYRQNDAFLFLCGLISNQIERCCNSLQTTAVFFDRVFKTTWRNEVICTACSHKSITYKQEQAIQVGLGKVLIGSIRDWAGPYPLNDYNEILDMSEFCEHPEEDARYRLSASIVHVGNTPRSGHYYAYAKTASGWVKFNDSTTTNVVLETTLRDKPYILFYTKENTSSTATVASSTVTVASSSSSNIKTNTSLCNTIKYITKKQSVVSLNSKISVDIQSSTVENVTSIKSETVKDSCDNKNSCEIVDAVKIKNKDEQVVLCNSKELEKINPLVNINESNDNIGLKESDKAKLEVSNVKPVSRTVEIPEEGKNNKSTIITKCFIASTTFISDQENLQATDTPSIDSSSLEPMISEEPGTITLSTIENALLIPFASDVKTTEVIKKDLVEKSSEMSTLGKRKERENDYEQSPVNKQKLNKITSNVQHINDIPQEHISIEEWQVQKNKQTALSNPIIISQFSSNSSKSVVNDQSINDFCQINTASNERNCNENSTTVSLCSKGTHKIGHGISVVEYGQCRWIVENLPSINSLNDCWKKKFSHNRNKMIRKKRKGKLKARVRSSI
ncbi:19393_t:CDS:2 [Cetraspora pellucida]|uniref:ubiquitinyl hydrolase 1 n=1 Tax=Cetraspora pellucida TaxID=1433469 RepID=A0A9N9EU42_9GLOM|nr:19393_t:CDS:2 [Cetraspora pellucida]